MFIFHFFHTWFNWSVSRSYLYGGGIGVREGRGGGKLSRYVKWMACKESSILVYTLLVEILMAIVPHSTDLHISLIIILLLCLIYLIAAWTSVKEKCGKHFIQLNLKESGCNKCLQCTHILIIYKIINSRISWFVLPFRLYFVGNNLWFYFIEDTWYLSR